MANNSLLILTGPGFAASQQNSLSQIAQDCLALCEYLNLELRFVHAQTQQQLADQLVQEGPKASAVIVDPGADVAEMDRASLQIKLQTVGENGVLLIEAHRQNIFSNDDVAGKPLRVANTKLGFVSGLGPGSYLLAVQAIHQQLTGSRMSPSQAEEPIKAVVLNGPNLNLLGTREPEVYGYDTLDQIAERCALLGDSSGVQLEFLQSNSEGQLVDWIQESISNVDAIIINAGAYTHTSIAIHDALKAFKGYKIELHISNPHLREEFRHLSYISPAADAVVAGLGVAAYEHCIQLLPNL